MRVMLRNGETGTIDSNVGLITSDRGGFYDLDYYRNNLTRTDNSYDVDIVSVSDVIWAGNDKVELTISDIEEMLGFKIKIIN